MLEKDVERVLLTQEEIEELLDGLAERINKDYNGRRLIAVGILKGAAVFYADLVRRLNAVDVRFDFMAVSSYGASTKSAGAVRILKDLDHSIEGEDVLIVEDIVDTGLTLKYLVDNLTKRGARSVKICCLLDKPERRKTEIDVHYAGRDIENAFVVGYGLDYNERYRNLPYVGVLKPEIYS